MTKELEEKIGQLVGAASMCWSNVEGAGVYNSDKAKEIFEEILRAVKEEYEKTSKIQ